MVRSVLGVIFAATLASVGGARAAIIVDGSYDADYGAPKSIVTYDPTAPESNFGTPTPFTDAIGYSIYLADQGGSLYGYLKSAGPLKAVAPFANLYFDLDAATRPGSDLGFEVTNKDAFIPGVAGNVPLGNITYAISADKSAIEFSIPNIDFTAPIAGLTYDPSVTFPAAGDPVVLRLSESFGYSVAGGASFGPDRLGSVTLSAVPLPPALPLFAVAVLGLGLARSIGGRNVVRS